MIDKDFLRYLIFTFLVSSVLLIPGTSYALDCPGIPEQTQKDSQVEVRAAVDRIGSAKGVELEKLTRNTTRNLLGSSPRRTRFTLSR